jgi:beta-galactosidase
LSEVNVMKRKPAAPLSVWRPLSLDDFLFGAPHYPEHVDRSYWDRDAERMAAAGFNVIRMGEFAWHLFEPREGKFEFDLFDEAIELFGRAGIKTIMCTPTATPPRWLTFNYPEVLRVDVNGRMNSHGSRQHADTSSPVFRTHSRRITSAMAEHYKANEHVIGWQTDNEFNNTVATSYSNATLKEFQRFLQDKYGTIEALNHAWGGHFWALWYDHFDHVVLPIQGNPIFVSPGHMQDFHRFLAHSVALFQHEQVEILRATNPDWFVFHNLGQIEDIDFRGQFGQDLDFLGFDIYPMLYDELERGGSLGGTQALHMDVNRAFTGNFIVPEQQSGSGSQIAVAMTTPEPGEMRRMALSSIARGADGLLFFRWRPAHFGAESYWMGIIDHDNVPRRRYDELVQFGEDIANIKGDLLGTHVRMDVGIAGADFDNEEAYRANPMGLPSPHQDAALLHAACYSKGIACGFIHPSDDLSRLKVFYIPHWSMWKPEWDANVRSFVENGGTLVVGGMSGTRDANNHVHRELAPGPCLSQLCGVRVEEFGRVVEPGGDGLFARPSTAFGFYSPAEVPPASSTKRRYTFTLGNREFDAGHLYEVLQVQDDVEILGRWSSRFIEGRAAVTSRKQGRGQSIYLGTYLTKALAEGLVEQVLPQSGVAPLIGDLPDGVEVTVRQGEAHHLTFVLNSTDASVAMEAGLGGVDLLTGEPVGGSLRLPPYGCAVVKTILT